MTSASASPALLFEISTGKVLYSEDADDVWYPASLTKLTTAYLAFQAIKDGKYGATGLNDPALVASTAVDLAKNALDGDLPADISKITYTTPTAITKDNVDKYLKKDAVF